MKKVALEPEVPASIRALSSDRIEDPSTRAKRRWKAMLGRVTMASHQAHEEEENENLIDEIKRIKRKNRPLSKKRKEGVLHILHSHHEGGSTGLERHKYSARERILKRRNGVRDDSYFSFQDYDNQARLRYPITSDIQIKLERIKKETAKQREKEARTGSKGIFKRCFGKLFGWLASTNFGVTLKANHRFYKMSPHEHLPELCRRCRRPLAGTLEGRFTSVGILFCFLLPIVGFLLLYANREFHCVVCNELYVYGDLTARVEEYTESEDED